MKCFVPSRVTLDLSRRYVFTTCREQHRCLVGSTRTFLMSSSSFSSATHLAIISAELGAEIATRSCKLQNSDQIHPSVLLLIRKGLYSELFSHWLLLHLCIEGRWHTHPSVHKGGRLLNEPRCWDWIDDQEESTRRSVALNAIETSPKDGSPHQSR